MSIDNEIMQEFLVEAGELFEQLNDQFVELEQNPEDSELLNAIFRAYHTIKGGAGFMKLTPMVEVCHRAEDVINLVRQNELQVSAELIDVMFQALDELDGMFAAVRSGEALPDADAALLAQLDALLAQRGGAAPAEQDNEQNDEEPQPSAQSSEPETAAQNEPPEDSPKDPMDAEFEAMLQSAQQEQQAAPTPESQADDLITDEEFEAVLDQLHGEGKGPTAPVSDTPAATGDADLITDDEFEAVLDQLHGKGKGPGAADAADAAETPETPASGGDDLITDEEFEAVLDQLHGKGKGPSAQAAPASTPPEQAESSAPEPAPEPAPAPEQAKAPATPASAPDNVVKLDEAPKPAATKKAAPPAETSVRVDTARLDNIMNLVGELVLVRNRLSTLKQSIHNPNVCDAISTLDLVTSDLQASVMKTRMQPIKKVFSRFPRVIRDLARKLKKDINLELIGEETDLDKSLVEALADPLIHLVRNAADHGIEPPEERFAAGKPRQGKVTLSAQQEGDQILLTVSDDGKGMDHNVLRRKAVEKGMMSEDAARALTNKEAYNLIFAPGFSTKDEISDVSGRGVGMDVVKTRINELNGTIEIDSSPGEGSVIVIHLPLTLAILPTLMVNLNRYQFALPLTNVLEAFNMEPQNINVIDGQEVIRVRDKPLPLFYLHPWLVRDAEFGGPQLTQKVIVVQMGNQRFCLVVDHIAGQEEVVIKPLGNMLANTPGFAGATITGDGSIALILDISSLMGAYAANSAVY